MVSCKKYFAAGFLLALVLSSACSQPPTSAKTPDNSDRNDSGSTQPFDRQHDDITPGPAVEPEPPINAATFDNVDIETVTLAAANTQFGLDLYQLLRHEPGNLFFSPYSISTALAMTYAGARGQTARQMATALHLPATDVHPIAAALAQSLVPRSSAYDLRIANRLWAQQGMTLQPAFRRITQQYYAADLGLLDFENANEPARLAINAWVETQTNNKIIDLLPRGSISRLTRLVLTNAIYFKGTWLRQFDETQTHDAMFFAQSPRSVPLMYQRARFNYSETDSLQTLQLSYEGDALSMFVLLPRERNGLSTAEDNLSATGLGLLLDTMRPTEVDVWLPRFAASAQFELSDALAQLGIEDAFVPALADFSGINGQKTLYITQAIHQAFVEVNEEGSEAAAATAVVMGIESESQTVSFRADHPFIFLIRDDRSGAVLFLGRLVDPQT